MNIHFHLISCLFPLLSFIYIFTLPEMNFSTSRFFQKTTYSVLSDITVFCCLFNCKSHFFTYRNMLFAHKILSLLFNVRSIHFYPQYTGESCSGCNTLIHTIIGPNEHFPHLSLYIICLSDFCYLIYEPAIHHTLH